MQGFNMGRYHSPSSLDPCLSTTASGKPSHPLGVRARKLPSGGGLIVRFEMPFAIWCSTCPSSSNNQLIGQGVRFNAEKKKAGNYFSTPVWSFRMKHTACGGWIEIRTDPKSSDFVVSEGARKRDTGDDAMVGARMGALVLPGGVGEKEKERQDAFEALEGKKVDKVQTTEAVRRIEELWTVGERDWRDPDAMNRKLRAAFRVGRRARDRDGVAKERLQEQMSLGIELLDENEEDKKRAGFVDFGEVIDVADNATAALRAGSKPLFGSIRNVTTNKVNIETRKVEGGKGAVNEKIRTLHQELAGNTRAALDPFTTNSASGGTPANARPVPAIKRKRREVEMEPDMNLSSGNAGSTATEPLVPAEEKGHHRQPKLEQTACAQAPLVSYDSD